MDPKKFPILIQLWLRVRKKLNKRVHLLSKTLKISAVYGTKSTRSALHVSMFFIILTTVHIFYSQDYRGRRIAKAATPHATR